MVPLWNENSPHWKEKAKVETANWPPSQEKEKEKKDRDIGNAGNADACLRTVRTWSLCVMKHKKKNMNMTKKLTGLTGQEPWRMTTGVTVITVTTTRTHTGLKTPSGGLMVGMTTGLGRQTLLRLCLQHRHRLSLDHRPALQWAPLVSLKEELHLPHRTLYRMFQLSTRLWRSLVLRLVRHTLMPDPLHALCTKDLDWLEHFLKL